MQVSRRRRWAVAFALLALTGLAGALPGDSAVLARLEQGEIIVTRLAQDSPRLFSGQVQGVIDAPVERCLSILNDGNAYSSFMPHHLVSWVIPSEALAAVGDGRGLSPQNAQRQFEPYRLDNPSGDTTYLFAVLSIHFPLSNIWYVLKMVSDPAAGLLTWDMMSGSIASTTGSWQLEALGERTLATYRTTTDLGYALPGFLVSLAMNRDLPNTIKAVRRQAE
jgi:hypothetical protein